MHLLHKQPEVTTPTVSIPLCTKNSVLNRFKTQNTLWSNQKAESQKVDWLILHFNQWFSYSNVTLVRGNFEPEYFPAQNEQPARIQFAHGFFNSALHEISHWCIAGQQRRGLADLGYWYAPDGRSEEQQALFEQVEVKPQAIEWLFAQAFGLKFRVSLDNLTGEGGNGTQFKDHVFAQVQQYFAATAKLPIDAQYFIHQICACTRDGNPLYSHEFRREMLD
ncbi:hypothetical protein EC844_10620 [Acinetobacter calcoaceticus]|uniref:Elongation factor P hydroxylase n=1 Tax=Acinetobacter calcoaceticus TaxID=471 RepID=A0A4V2R1C8_ACICA|nr:hypothetical protein EC844_10620 [Acinetobacter calcoaceticus]